MRHWGSEGGSRKPAASLPHCQAAKRPAIAPLPPFSVQNLDLPQVDVDIAAFCDVEIEPHDVSDQVVKQNVEGIGSSFGDVFPSSHDEFTVSPSGQ